MRIPCPDKTKLSSDHQDVAHLSPGLVSGSLAITGGPGDTSQPAGSCDRAGQVCVRVVSDSPAAAQARCGGPSLGHLSPFV